MLHCPLHITVQKKGKEGVCKVGRKEERGRGRGRGRRRGVEGEGMTHIRLISHVHCIYDDLVYSQMAD